MKLTQCKGFSLNLTVISFWRCEYFQSMCNCFLSTIIKMMKEHSTNAYCGCICSKRRGRELDCSGLVLQMRSVFPYSFLTFLSLFPLNWLLKQTIKGEHISESLGKTLSSVKFFSCSISTMASTFLGDIWIPFLSTIWPKFSQYLAESSQCIVCNRKLF